MTKASEAFNSQSAEYLSYLTKGQLPPPTAPSSATSSSAGYSLTHFEELLIMEGFKYPVKVGGGLVGWLVG